MLRTYYRLIGIGRREQDCRVVNAKVSIEIAPSGISIYVRSRSVIAY